MSSLGEKPDRFIEKILEIFAVWIDFRLARFDRYAHSLQQRVLSFYTESNGISGSFLDDLYTNKVNLPNEKILSRFGRS